MKAVMISIQPKWCELIASGKKTIEVRKTRPKIDVPFKCYIYQTKKLWVYSLLCELGFDDLAHRLAIATGKVIGEFVCDEIKKGTLTVSDLYDSVDIGYNETCLTVKDIKAYLGMEYVERKGNYRFYGWHISDLVIYDKPKELSEFNFPPYRDCDIQCKKCRFGIPVETILGVEYDCDRKLKRPPQSWCYVTEQWWWR